jgi:hypothetical protein
MNALNDLDLPTGQREYKAFATLAAQYAISGLALIKGDPAVDGQARYFALCWGSMAKPLPDLDAAGAYLATLGSGGGTAKQRGQR